MHKIEKNVEKHLLEEGKVYMVIKGKPVELPIVDGRLYMVENDELTPLPMPDTGFGTVTIAVSNNKIMNYKCETMYKKNEITRKGN